jgi:hypothetical protein
MFHNTESNRWKNIPIDLELITGKAFSREGFFILGKRR